MIHNPGARKFSFDLFLAGAVKDRGQGAEAETLGGPTQMNFKHLTDIHPSRHTQRIQDQIHRRSVFEERHILHRDNLGNNALIAMAAGHLISGSDLAALGNRDTHHHIHTRREVGIVFTGKDFHIHHLAAFTMRHPQRGVLYVAGLFAKDGAQQSLFRGEFLFALRRDLADQDIIRPHFRADADDPRFIQILDGFFTDVGNITRDLLRSQFGIARFDFIFLDMNRSEAILLDQAFGEQNGVFEVAAFP